MFPTRIFAGISVLAFGFALGGTLRMAAAEYAWRWGSLPRAQLAMTIGSAQYFEGLAERQSALDRDALRTAVQLNPRDSTAWMALGLAAERDGDMEVAANSLLEAEKVDRQYMPAWTSANFFFRRANDLQFWRAATRAAAMSYDDPAPLIELTDHREPDALTALERLGDEIPGNEHQPHENQRAERQPDEHRGDYARLERGYLRFLIGKSRWQEAEEVAARLSLDDIFHNTAPDRELLLNFTDRLISANQAEAALAVWSQLGPAVAEPAAHGMLVDPNFERRPSGHGFDWRVTQSLRGSLRWAPSKLEFWPAETTPDACTLIEQSVILDPGRYRLRYEYRTVGLAADTGLHWALLYGGRVETSSAEWAPLSKRVPKADPVEWNFRVERAGLYELAWIYSRAPGTIHQEGRAELAFAGLEAR